MKTWPPTTKKKNNPHRNPRVVHPWEHTSSRVEPFSGIRPVKHILRGPSQTGDGGYTQNHPPRERLSTKEGHPLLPDYPKGNHRYTQKHHGEDTHLQVDANRNGDILRAF